MHNLMIFLWFFSGFSAFSCDCLMIMPGGGLGSREARERAADPLPLPTDLARLAKSRRVRIGAQNGKHILSNCFCMAFCMFLYGFCMFLYGFCMCLYGFCMFLYGFCGRRLPRRDVHLHHRPPGQGGPSSHFPATFARCSKDRDKNRQNTLMITCMFCVLLWSSYDLLDFLMIFLRSSASSYDCLMMF